MTAITLLAALALIMLAGAGIAAWARNARKTGANAPGALACAAVAIAAAGTLAIAPTMPAFAADESHHADDDHTWSTDEIAVDDASETTSSGSAKASCSRRRPHLTTSLPRASPSP